METRVSIDDSKREAVAIVEELATETGWSFVPDAWTGHEWLDAVELERDKYASPAWNEKR